MVDLKNKRILITGGGSMLAVSLVDELTREPSNEVYTVYHKTCDLLSIEQTREKFLQVKPDIVIHLATYSGSAQFNVKFPIDTFYRTTLIGLNVLKVCSEIKPKKVLSILSSCAIADKGDVELKETDLWNGLPCENIESHGFAKRNLHAFSRQLYKQCGIDAVCCIVNNSFGPRDAFSLEKGKVISNLIKRFIEAKEKNMATVTLWGTGKPLREFIYCKDVAKLLMLALERHNDSITPLNIGSPNEISIKELAETIKLVVEYEGELLWDTSKGDGQMRKKLDLTRMNKVLLDNGPFNYTTFQDSLAETVKWYLENRSNWTK